MKRILGLLLLFTISVMSFAQYNECTNLIKDVDKFNGNITYRTKTNRDVILVKALDEKKENINYYINLYAYGNTVNVNKRGITILFEDGSKLERPNAEISVDVNTYGSKGFTYRGFERITYNELIKLTTKKIVAYRLYVYGEDVSNKDAETLLNDAECIRKIFPHPTTDIH